MAPPGAIRMDETSGRDWIARSRGGFIEGSGAPNAAGACPLERPNPSNDPDWDHAPRKVS
jgi:hypothetical protein